MPGPSLEKRLRPLALAPPDGLVVHEIYASIQGESTHAGKPCTFVRTTGCHLRCGYCDTPHAFTQGAPMSLEEVEARVVELGVPMVEVTGGEPLLQPNVLPLMTRLCDAGYEVLLETSGAVDVAPVDSRVVKIMDLKAPDSGECAANRWENLDHLLPHDEIKFVLASRADYEWARDVCRQRLAAVPSVVLMGTVHGALDPAQLAQWLVEDRLNARLQLQMHKVLWDPKARGV